MAQRLHARDIAAGLIESLEVKVVVRLHELHELTQHLRQINCMTVCTLLRSKQLDQQ